MSTHSKRADPPLARELARLMQNAFGDLLREAAQAENAPPLKVTPAAQPIAPARLAATHPGGPKARAEAQQLYLKCLRYYRSQVQPVATRQAPAVPDTDEVSTAAAYFALANLACLQPHLQPDEQQLALVARQLRRLIGSSEAWTQANEAGRQLLFEQFAIIGVLINESRVQAATQGAAAQLNLQRAARNYLVQMLGLDPDLLAVGTEGLQTPTTVH